MPSEPLAVDVYVVLLTPARVCEYVGGEVEDAALVVRSCR
jgi:hypothetical protein